MSYEGFLPPGSIQMTKRRQARASHAETHGNPAADVVLIHEDLSAPARDLLIKMLGALGLGEDQVFRIALGEDHALAQTHPKAFVFFGQKAAEAAGCPAVSIGTFQDYRGAKALVTFSPEELLDQPALKKTAWSHLQLLAKELGIQIPSKR